MKHSCAVRRTAASFKGRRKPERINNYELLAGGAYCQKLKFIIHSTVSLFCYPGTSCLAEELCHIQ
jgi:hypothetical protein